MVMCSDERNKENPERLSAMQIELPCFKKAPPVAKNRSASHRTARKTVFRATPHMGFRLPPWKTLGWRPLPGGISSCSAEYMLLMSIVNLPLPENLFLLFSTVVLLF